MKKSIYSKLSIGVVGCGGIGKAHLNNYEMNGVKITAIADFNPDTAKKAAEKYQCKFYTNYREIFYSYVIL